MRVDRVIRDTIRSLRQALQALDHNVTVQDNFGASGVDENWIIVSVGKLKIPVWKKGGDFISENITQDTIQKIVTQVTIPAPTGGDGGGTTEPPPPPGHWEPLAFAGEILFDNEGDVVEVWVTD